MNRHNVIVTEIIVALHPAVGARCILASSDAKVIGDQWSRYPDVVLSCDERDRLDEARLRYPKLIVEVLSASTHATDREEKFDQYLALESLEEYLMIDSRRRWAQAIRRSAGEWIVSLPQSSGTVDVASAGVAIDLDALYARVEL